MEWTGKTQKVSCPPVVLLKQSGGQLLVEGLHIPEADGQRVALRAYQLLHQGQVFGISIHPEPATHTHKGQTCTDTEFSFLL